MRMTSIWAVSSGTGLRHCDLRRIEHLNLVRFHGYLEFGGEQLIIVEYVPNGIFGSAWTVRN
jgi:hypothetical protein